MSLMSPITQECRHERLGGKCRHERLDGAQRAKIFWLIAMLNIDIGVK